MKLNSYLNKGISYDEYLIKIKNQLLDLEKNGDPQKMAQHYSLNIKRMERLDKTFELSAEQKSKLKSKLFDLNFLVISEGWCGDAAQVLPIIHKIAEEINVETKIVFRDENPELIEQFLTNGTKSIPVIIGLSKEGDYLFRYGPRPKEAMDLLNKTKENPEIYPKEQFYTDLQKWYNQDKGKSIFSELYNLFS